MAVRSKMSIATMDIILQVKMFHKFFLEVPNILMYQDQKILIIVEGHQPHCWSCCAAGHMTHSTGAMTEVMEKSDKDPKNLKEVVRKKKTN